MAQQTLVTEHAILLNKITRIPGYVQLYMDIYNRAVSTQFVYSPCMEEIFGPNFRIMHSLGNRHDFDFHKMFLTNFESFFIKL